MLACYDVTEGKIREKGEVVKKEIDQSIEQHVSRLQELIVTLRKSKESLLRDADAATNNKLTVHSLERIELEEILVRLKRCKEFVEEEVKLQSRYQMLSIKKKLIQCVKDAHSEVKVSELQPGQSADTEYVRNRFTISPPDVGSVKSTVNYQLIYRLLSVNIPKCLLNGVTTEVSLMSSLPFPAEGLQCKLKSTAHSTSCLVKQAAMGHFKVLLNPSQPGVHELSVYICDTQVPGSPFKIPVMSIAEWRGQRLKVFARGLRHPRGLAVTDDGKHVIVTEWHGHCVVVFSAVTGELLYRIGGHDTGSRNITNPDKVEVSSDNYIFVKDKESIQKFTLNGLHVTTIVISCMGVNLQFNYGMAILPCGSVLTSVRLPLRTGSSIIKVKPPSLQESHWQWSEFITPNTFDGEPADIAVDTEGKIFVLTLEYGIHALTPEGKYISSFGKGAKRLISPYEFCIDSNNIIYVTDGKEVKIFNTDGRCIMGSFGNHPKLKGIAVSKTTNDLYITKANGEVYSSSNK